MNKESAYIFEASAQDFAQKVLEQSAEQPVLVDFWADWCAPCKMLMPVLASLAEEYQGQFLLVKVNSDENQDLAMQYGVRSLPTVKVFRHGQIVDEFMGALSESQVRTFLDKHIEHASDRATTEAAELYRQGNVDAAVALLQQTIEAGPANDKPSLLLAEIQIQEGQLEQAEALLEGLGWETRAGDRYEQLSSKLQFALKTRDAPDTETLLQRISDEPGNLEARSQLGALMVARQDYEPAMEQYMEIVRRDRAFDGDAGRKALLDIFKMLGDADERVRKYRRLLATALN